LTRYRNLWLEHGELYFYQKLLLRVPARSEGDLIGTYETYHDHYLARFSIVDTVADHKNNYFIGQIFVDLISNYHIISNFDWFDNYYKFSTILKMSLFPE
jgi:hypothetical protein